MSQSTKWRPWPGEQVVIEGTGFGPTAVARIDGVDCYNQNVISLNAILATTPAAGHCRRRSGIPSRGSSPR